MNITATARGGFAGKGEHYEIDTSTNRHGRALEAALADHGFFQAQSASPPPMGADLLHWTITVNDGTRGNTITFCEDGRSESLRWESLLKQIRAAA
ncbi:MAG: protealysin inhibitor emfourin [Sphingomonadaceae bacterium]